MENKKAVAVENAAEDTIDLLEIFRALYRRWVWIVFTALVFGIALGMYGKFVVKDVFQAEASMCIIDSNTDMRKSVLQRRMGLEGVKLGLSEYLSGNAEVGQVIYDVGIPNMHVLFSGKLVTNASALLSAKWLRTLCDSVKDSYDYIIFDTPPVGVVGDAAIVSSVCDGTLLVIENGVTKKKTLCQIAAELEKIDTNILGVVQNMVGSKKDSSYYGKGNYGYYYGNNQNKK